MLSALTIDFWNTLFGTDNGLAREQSRQRVLRDELAASGYYPKERELESARDVALEHFRSQWIDQQYTPGSSELVSVMLADLRVNLSSSAVTRIEEVFARGVIEHPPQLLPGARETIESFAEHVPLAIISDTAFSPGSVLRELMGMVGIAEYFSAFVFSDETGVAKPDPVAFKSALDALGVTADHAVHIGDIERTDIKGALGYGMHAVLYCNVENRHQLAEDATEADAVIKHWNELSSAVKDLK